MTCSFEQALLRDDADGAWVSGGRGHEAEHSVNEAPITVEKSSASIDEMLQHGPDVREGSRVALEWRQSLRSAVLQLQPTVASLVDE